jgi:FMN phosphatase YigB (HAD superfamily)
VGLVSIAVFDIDGVVADVRHRVHYVEQRRKDWDRFFGEAAADPALTEGVRRVHAAAAAHEIVWLTGRPEWLRAVTEDWLADHGLPNGNLLMRASHDFRPARFFKVGVLRELAELEIASFVDDDPDVIDVARAAGFPATLATWIPRSSALADAQERSGRS